MIERPFAKLLKDYRKKNNLTQKELAKILDVTKSTIVAYEKGTTDPSVIVLYKAAKNLNFSIDELFELSSPKLHITDEHINYVPKKKIKKSIPKSTQKEDLITLQDLILKNRRTFEELTMSKKRNDLIYNELKRAINRSTQSEDMFLEVSSKLLKILENNNIDSLENITNIADSLSNSSNEHLATLEKDTIEPEDSSDDYFDYDNYLSYNFNDSDEYTKLPLLGEVAAGNPREAIEIVDDYYSIPSDRLSPNCEYFLLRVKGDSMNKLYDNGDILLVQRKGFFDNGTLVIALIDNDDPIDRYNATFKRYYKYDDIIELHPESTNPIHKVQKYSAKDTIILGAVLGSLREYVE
ncbi:MAG: S24 family peptidase [Clostridium perfringens]|nr:S24 family peptidase [Clostridium perfringens]